MENPTGFENELIDDGEIFDLLNDLQGPAELEKYEEGEEDDDDNDDVGFVFLEDDVIIGRLSTALDDEDTMTHPSSSSSSATKTILSTKNGLPKKRKFNPDADNIAKATEEALQSLELDPTSNEAKKKKRQIRNRLSAQFHRDRKNQYIHELEEHLKVKEHEMEKLKREVDRLKAENDWFRIQITAEKNTYRNNFGLVESSNTPVMTDMEASVACSSSSIGTHSPSPVDSPLLDHKHSNFATVPSFLPNQSASMRASQGQRNSLTTTFVKPLAYLCLLAVLCLTYFPIQENIFNLSESDRLMTDKTTDLVGVSEHTSRRLVVLSSEPPAALASPIMNASTTFSTKSNVRNLRSRYTSNTVSNKNSSSTVNGAFYVSRDLIPFHITKDAQENWFSYRERLNALSSSQIYMQKGFTLLDPNFKVFSSASSNEVNGMVPFKPILDADDALTTPYVMRALPGGADVKHMERNKAAVPDESKQAKNWPLVTTIFNQHKSVVPADKSSNDMNEKRGEGINNLHKFISMSNIVTVTVPMDTIRLGTSAADSKHATMENVMQMFNMSSIDGKEQTVGVASMLVEMSCIILGAKVMLNAPTGSK